MIEGREYEVSIASFEAGSSGSYWDPPEPGEVELGAIVSVGEDYVPFDVFLLYLAVELGETGVFADVRARVQELVESETYEAWSEHLAERADDRYED